jgi:hypothetical protein
MRGPWPLRSRRRRPLSCAAHSAQWARALPGRLQPWPRPGPGLPLRGPWHIEWAAAPIAPSLSGRGRPPGLLASISGHGRQPEPRVGAGGPRGKCSGRFFFRAHDAPGDDRTSKHAGPLFKKGNLATLPAASIDAPDIKLKKGRGSLLRSHHMITSLSAMAAK